MKSKQQVPWVGPYIPTSPISAGWKLGELLFLSGQVPRDSDSGSVVEKDARRQTTQVLDNLEQVIRQYDASLRNVVRCTVYITSTDHFDAYNRVFEERFEAPYPARTTIVCDLVNPEYLIELDAIVHVDC